MKYKTLLSSIAAVLTLSGCTVAQMPVKGLEYTEGKTATVDDSFGIGWAEGHQSFVAAIGKVNGKETPGFVMTSYGLAATSSISLPAEVELDLDYRCLRQSYGEIIWEENNSGSVKLESGKCYALYGKRTSAINHYWIKTNTLTGQQEQGVTRSVINNLHAFCPSIGLREVDCELVID